METVGVTRCQSCQAVVNVHWSACLACHEAILKDHPEGSSPGASKQARSQSGEERPCWAPGDRVQVKSMDGTTACGVGMSTDWLEEAPFKRGTWYLIWTKTGYKWVHERLIRGA